MSVKKFFSTKLDKEFEFETVVTEEGLCVVRAKDLEMTLNALGGAVQKDLQICERGVIVKLSDDTGFAVYGMGDWEAKSLKNTIAKEYPMATAYSRAIADAVIKYLGFEGRIYSDASFPEVSLEDEVISEPAEVEVVKPVKKAKTTKVPSASATADTDLGSYVWTTGAAKGLTLDEIMLVNTAEGKFSKVKPRKGMTIGQSYLAYLLEQGLGKADELELLRKYLAQFEG